LSLIRSQKVPFFLRLFRYFFYARALTSGKEVNIGSRPKKKLLEGSKSKFHNWNHSYFFVSVPEDFPLPRTWAEGQESGKDGPEMSVEEIRIATCLLNLPKEVRNVNFLLEEEQLVLVGLSPGRGMCGPLSALLVES
jgi:hypothetical protein